MAKGLLFLTSGSVQQATGTRNLDEMGGLAKRMPVTAATNLDRLAVDRRRAAAGRVLVASSSSSSPWSRPGEPVLAVIAVLASVLTLWYYLILQRKAFFGKLNERWAAVKEAPFWMTAATVILALLCLALGHLLLRRSSRPGSSPPPTRWPRDMGM